MAEHQFCKLAVVGSTPATGFMPSVNIYTSKKSLSELKLILPKLKKFIAEKLSCEDRNIESNEISIRIIIPSYPSQIAETEIIITAYSYPQRIQNQDTICLEIKKFLASNAPSIKSVYIWLQLSELGHSQ